MIFILNGPPGSGKDAACEFFETLGYIHYSFKEQLFIETCKYFNVSLEWFMADYNRIKKETPVDELQGYSRRTGMIHVSENIIKPKYGNSYFGVQLANNLEQSGKFCVSDGGFEDEITPIINKLGADNITLIQLTREGCTFSSDSRRYINATLIEKYVLGFETHIIKTHILEGKLPIKAYRVHNNATVDNFYTVLQQIHEKETNARERPQKKGFETQSFS